MFLLGQNVTYGKMQINISFFHSWEEDLIDSSSYEPDDVISADESCETSSESYYELAEFPQPQTQRDVNSDQEFMTSRNGEVK